MRFKDLEPDTQRKLFATAVFVLCAFSISGYSMPAIMRVIVLFTAFCVAYFAAPLIDFSTFTHLADEIQDFIRSAISRFRAPTKVSLWFKNSTKSSLIFKSAPGMAFFGVFLVVSLSVAGFIWSWVVGQ